MPTNSTCTLDLKISTIRFLYTSILCVTGSSRIYSFRVDHDDERDLLLPSSRFLADASSSREYRTNFANELISCELFTRNFLGTSRLPSSWATRCLMIICTVSKQGLDRSTAIGGNAPFLPTTYSRIGRREKGNQPIRVGEVFGTSYSNGRLLREL